MHHSSSLNRFERFSTRLVRLLISAALAAFISACATTNGPVISSLPDVDPESAATLTVRSKDNFSDTKHRHFLSIDGLAVAMFKEEDVKSFQIAEGKHLLTLTCHSRNIHGSNDLPFNFNVVDGNAKMDLDVLAGDSICLKIGFGPLDCAQLLETGPSYCE